MNLGKFSVSNPVLINILWVAIFILGLFSFTKLPRELYSDISFSWVFIAVPYPGASAEEIEKSVTIKIEDELADITEIKKISSISRKGVSFVQIEFDDALPQREFQRLYQDVRTEFDKVSLPEGTIDPIVDDFSTADFAPIFSVIISGDIEESDLNKKAQSLQDILKEISGVSNVEILGNREREVWVEASKDKLDAYGLSLTTVADAIRYRNMNIPGGVLETESRQYILQTLGELNRIDDFGKVIVRRRPGQGSLKVSDIATINKGLGDAVYEARFNGKRAISLEVSKQKDASSIEVVDACKAAIKEFESINGESIKINYFNDTTYFIREVLRTLSSNALAGFIFLVLVLFFFLGFKNSILTAMAIPITFAITFIFMEYSGETLNGNTLFALVLVLGMIVDHAIVIMENSYRHRQEGLDKYEAAIIGTNEVVKPIIAGTLTTVGAFLPLMLLPGLMGKFMRSVPLVVSFALAASTLEALIFLPVHFADWGGKVKDEGEGLVSRFKNKFKKVVTKIYMHRYLTLVFTGLLIITTIFTFPFLKQDLFAGESFTYFFVNIKMPNGTPRKTTNEITARFEEKLLPLIGNGEIAAINTTVGYQLTDTDRLNQSNVAQISVDIAERTEGRTRPIKKIMDEVSKMLADIPGAEKVEYRTIRNGPPVDAPVSFRIQGEDLDNMAALADEYVNMLEEYPDLYNVGNTFEKGIPELRIDINEERAADLGLNAALIGKYIRECFDGIEATTFYDNDEEIDVIVRFAEEDRESIEIIKSMKFPTMDGRMIPFSTVCKLEHGTGIFSIVRVEGKREITVSAETESEDKKNLVSTIEKRVEEEYEKKYKKLFPGIALKMGGEFAEFNKLITDIIRLLWIGIFFIYIILGAQFKSYMQPFIILMTVPFAFVGCLLFLFTTQTPVSLIVLYAGVALVGISVNDSIVLISFINSLRRKGVATTEAVINGAVTRLRPIILTSVTTIGGLLPMALGIGGKSETWAPMASTIIFGLFFSTAGTLLVIPCAYGILNDLMEKMGFHMKLEGE